MLRVPSGDGKENIPTMGGCNCKRQKVKISNNLNNLELFPSKVLVDNLRQSSLRDISSEKNKMICRCTSNAAARTRSASEEDIVMTGMVASNKKRRGSTSTISDISNLQTNIIFQQNVIIDGKIQHGKSKKYVLKRELNKVRKEKHVKNMKSVSTNTTNLAEKNHYKVAVKSTSTTSVTEKRHIEKAPKSADVYRSVQFNFNTVETTQTTNMRTSLPANTNEIRLRPGTKTDSKLVQNRHGIDYVKKVLEWKRKNYPSIISQPVPPQRDSYPTITRQSETAYNNNSIISSNITKSRINNEVEYKMEKIGGRASEQIFKNQTSREKYQSHISPMMSSGLVALSIGSSISQISALSVQGSKTSSQKHTPISPNRFTDENIFISKKPHRLREPKVKRRSSINESRSTVSLPYVGDIYNEEYIHDIFANICVVERKGVLREGFLKTHNPNYKCRSGIANWLLKIQASLQFSESEHYLAVNLLDRVLAKIPVPMNMYQLLMMSTLWIATKIIGTRHIKASTLMRFSEGAYLIQQLVKMEQKVLKIMNFHISTVEPSLCASYYLKRLNLEKNDLAKLSVFYILDCFSLTPEFSSTSPSLLAAAAVNFTLNTYDGHTRENIHLALKSILSNSDLKTLKSVESQLFSQLVNMTDENYIFKEPYKKYGEQEHTPKVVDIIKA